MNKYDNNQHYCLFCDNYERDKSHHTDRMSYQSNINSHSTTFQQHEKYNIQNKAKSSPTNLNINRSHSNIKVCEKSISKCSVTHPCDRKVSNSNIRKYSHRKRYRTKTISNEDSPLKSFCGVNKSYDYYSNSLSKTRLEAGHSPSKCTIKSDYKITNSQGSNPVPPLTAPSSFGRRLESPNCIFSRPYYEPGYISKNTPHMSRGSSREKTSSRSDKSCDENYVSHHSFLNKNVEINPPLKIFGNILTSPYDERQIPSDIPSYDIRGTYSERPSYYESRQSYNDSKPSYNENKQSYNDSKPTFNESKLSYNKCEESYNDSKPSYDDSKPSYDESKRSNNESKQSYNDSKPSYDESKHSNNESKQSYNDSKPSYNTVESKIPSYVSENKLSYDSRPSYEIKPSAYSESKQQPVLIENQVFYTSSKPILTEKTNPFYYTEDKTSYEINKSTINDDKHKIGNTQQCPKETKEEFQKENIQKSQTKHKQTSFRDVTQTACNHGKSCSCIICVDKHCHHVELMTTPEELEGRKKIAEVCIQKKTCTLHPENDCSTSTCPESIRIAESCRNYHDGFAFSDIFQNNGSRGEQCTRYFLRFCVLCAFIKLFTWSWSAKEEAHNT